MALSTILKFVSIGWVGSAMLIGLLINGERLYSWIGRKFMVEVDWMEYKLDIMFIDTTKKNLIRLYACYLISLVMLGLFLLYPNLGAGSVMGIMLAIVGWGIPRRVLTVMFNRRLNKFVHQMVDGLTLISNSLRSGLNVPQAMQLVSDELPNPISQEFALVLSENKLGVSLEEALTNLATRLPHDDVEMFTTSINILKETGGNLAETFDKIAYTVRERIKLEGKIQAMTAQGVFQGIIVVIMPFALGAIMYSIDADRIRPMFTTLPGWAMLTIMVVLQVAGAWTIWKIVKVKV